ncbi:MAG: peptidylprolyl isomerase [Bacteroidaceae bacterium]|nr:peptidylprolyl isomerase [Bacteroidaceae bacterium]
MKKLISFAAFMLLILSCSSVKNQKVRIYTTEGDIDLVLYDETPKHRDNFVKLVKEQRYDSLLFHRVIKDFMIQGGDPDSRNAVPGTMLGEGDLGYRIEAEIMPEKYIHKRGVLAAAREGDDVNPTKASSASQFYIVWGRVFTPEELQQYKSAYEKRLGRPVTLSPEQVEAYTTIGGTPHLDGSYTVFGEVTGGLDVVDRIQNVKCDRNDRPIKDVRIIKVELIK